MPFDSIADRLLKAGIAPRHVRRYIGELEDHLDELRTQIQRSGCSGKEAELLARTRLGDENTLALAMLKQPGIHAWSAQMPWLIFCVVPTVIALAVFFAPLLIVKLISYFGGNIAPPNIIDPSSFMAVARSFIDASNLVIAPAISAIFAAMVARQRLHIRWALLAAVSVAVLDFHLSVQFPGGAYSGRLGLSADLWVGHSSELIKTLYLSSTQAALTLLPVAIALNRTIAGVAGRLTAED